jgi:type I restriction enzyme, S subunit
MTGSTVVPVRQVIASYIGGGWGSEFQDAEFSEPAAVIRGTDFARVGVGDVSSCPQRFHKTSNIRSRRLRIGDVIFEVSGGSQDQPVGRTLLVDKRILGRFDGDVIPASFCKLVRPNHDRVNPQYLTYFFEWLYMTREIMQFQVQSTGISNFQFEPFLDDQLMRLPSMEAQTKIAAILSAYDDLAVARLENLRETRSLLLPSLISGRLSVEGLEITLPQMA